MAEIALDITLGVEVQQKEIEIAVNRVHRQMTMTVDKALTPPVEYEGPYNVVSALYYDSEMETEGKLMKRNVVVEPIPIFDVTNPYGGRTITIGIA